MPTGKQALRDSIWSLLEDEGVARFPFPARGRIPNFDGADEAARRLADLREWREADVVKANPDSPQRPVRRRALEEGKVVYMAVPRLAELECFLRLDPAAVGDPNDASTIKGAFAAGETVGPDAVEPVDLIVAGSVAATPAGVRVGKGEGYSDLEYAVLRELGAVGEATPVCTTVHELQVVEGPEDEVPIASHDVPLDLVVTPERAIRTETPHTRPAGIDWDLLTEDRIAEMPVLGWLREREGPQ